MSVSLHKIILTSCLEVHCIFPSSQCRKRILEKRQEENGLRFMPEPKIFLNTFLQF